MEINKKFRSVNVIFKVHEKFLLDNYYYYFEAFLMIYFTKLKKNCEFLSFKYFKIFSFFFFFKFTSHKKNIDNILFYFT